MEDLLRPLSLLVPSLTNGRDAEPSLMPSLRLLRRRECLAGSDALDASGGSLKRQVTVLLSRARAALPPDDVAVADETVVVVVAVVAAEQLRLLGRRGCLAGGDASGASEDSSKRQVTVL